MNSSLALRIKKIRNYRNYTQAYMAKNLGIGQNTYSKIESGIITIKPARLESIAKLLNVQTQMILDENFTLFDIERSKNYTCDDLMEKFEKMKNIFQKEIFYLKQQNSAIIDFLKKSHLQEK